MKTRDRIKSTAIVLFNEKGATNVSTVQISEVMGISPGNLYYYFTNKEHIIRSIWEEDMIPQGDLIFLNTENIKPLEVLTTMMDIIMKHGLKYKFFYMEEYALFKNDSLLQQMYQKRWDFIVENLTDLFVVWQDKGYMRPSSRA
jgi:AcrR family transcriptional regulator